MKTHKKKQNETLKAWNGTEIGSFWKNQFDYGFQIILGTGFGFSSNFNLFKS